MAGLALLGLGALLTKAKVTRFTNFESNQSIVRVNQTKQQHVSFGIHNGNAQL